MASKIEVKNLNRNNIFRLIYASEGISKQEIADKLNLSLPTVGQNLFAMKEKGLIMETGLFQSTGGRKAKVISCVDNAKLALGLDITEHHISLVLIDMRGNILRSIRQCISYQDTDAYYNTIGCYIHDFIADSCESTDKILGVGVSLPAIIAEDGKRITYLTVFPGPYNLYQRLSNVIDFPIHFTNDSNAGGFAEFWVRSTTEQIVYLSLSNSVGGSILHSYQVYLGENQRSGEFGHMVLVPNGRPCYCGKRGCADAYCNARVLSNLTGGDLDLFFKEMHNGNSACQAAFSEYLEYLAQLVCNLRMCFDCDIVLGGYVGSHIDTHMDKLMELINAQNPFETEGTYVKSCEYRIEASAVGAALYFLEQYMRSI